MPAVTAFPSVERLNELLIVRPITARSACSHHLCPILGKVWNGIMPNEHSKLIGLSKYARICDWVMSRPQIQEEAVMQLANVLENMVKPDGLAIVIEADHFLPAMARGKRRRFPHEQQRNARLVPQESRSAARVSIAAEQEEQLNRTGPSGRMFCSCRSDRAPIALQKAAPRSKRRSP